MFIFIFMFILKEKPVATIDFTYMSVSYFEEWAKEQNLDKKNYQFEEIFDEDYDRRIILSQSLTPNTNIVDDDIIILYVSKGKDPHLEVQIPNFDGYKDTEIIKWFDDNSFTNYHLEYVQSYNHPFGYFVSINTDTMIQQRESEIIVQISTGPDPFEY